MSKEMLTNETQTFLFKYIYDRTTECNGFTAFYQTHKSCDFNGPYINNDHWAEQYGWAPHNHSSEMNQLSAVLKRGQRGDLKKDNVF